MNLSRFHLVVLAGLAATMAHSAQDFSFSIDPAKTWTSGYARVRLSTVGSFIGDFDLVKNISGTRTKAGFSPFTSPTQNEQVAAAPYFEMGHAALIRTSGTFHLSVNVADRTATLSDYSSNRVPLNNLSLSATVAPNNVAFRTAAPDALYSANMSPQALGTYNVDMFSVNQTASANTGTMTLQSDGTYRVSINFMAELQLRVAEFGQFAPMTFSVPYSLVGDLKIVGTTATFGYPRGTGAENLIRNVNVNLTTAPLQFGVGTTQIPGSYVFNTTIKTLGIQISGERQMFASGQ